MCLHFDLDRAAGGLSVANRNGGCGGQELAAVVWRVTSKAYRSEPSGGGRGVVLTEALWDVAAEALIETCGRSALSSRRWEMGWRGWGGVLPPF